MFDVAKLLHRKLQVLLHFWWKTFHVKRKLTFNCMTYGAYIHHKEEVGWVIDWIC